jgi:hypothetical protein
LQVIKLGTFFKKSSSHDKYCFHLSVEYVDWRSVAKINIGEWITIKNKKGKMVANIVTNPSSFLSVIQSPILSLLLARTQFLYLTSKQKSSSSPLFKNKKPLNNGRT